MDTQSMEIDVLIIADTRGENMLPLTQRTCPALLPVCGRPMIDHVLQSLISLNVNQIHLLVSNFSGQVRRFVGSGERWGFNIELTTTRGDSSVEDAIFRTKSSVLKPCLIIDSRYFVSLDLSAAIEQFHFQNEWLVQGNHNAHESGVYFLNPENEMPAQPFAETVKTVNLEMNVCQKITSLKDYYDINMMIASEKPEHVITRGKQMSRGIVVGPACVIAAENLEYGELHAGIGCRLHTDVICRGIVVLGDNVVIDRHTTITNSLVLDKTYISEHLHIENAIVWRNSLIRIDRNTSITLEDDRLLGSLSSTAISSKLTSLVGRILAAMVLLLSLPLWVIAFIDAAIGHGVQLVKIVRYIGNASQAHQPHREFKSVEIRSRFRILAKLPLLIEVIAGKIKWFGVSVREPEMMNRRYETWQHLRDDYPVGLIGPAQIELEEGCTTDEWLMADATFLGHGRMELLVGIVRKLLRFNHSSAIQSNVSSR